MHVISDPFVEMVLYQYLKVGEGNITVGTEGVFQFLLGEKAKVARFFQTGIMIWLEGR